MKLPEVYAFLTILHAMEGAAGELKDEVMNDSDLELIEKVARRFKNDVFSNKSFMETVDRFLDDGRREYSRSRRNGKLSFAIWTCLYSSKPRRRYVQPCCQCWFTRHAGLVARSHMVARRDLVPGISNLGHQT